MHKWRMISGRKIIKSVLDLFDILYNNTKIRIFQMTPNSSLLEDLSLILGDKDFDVIIKVGEDRNTKEFHAHSVILQTCSPYFKSAFSLNWIVKENGVILFNKPNITPIV